MGGGSDYCLPPFFMCAAIQLKPLAGTFPHQDEKNYRGETSMSSSLLATSKKIWSVFCTLAICIAVGMTTNHIAVADSATQNSNIVASLKYMSELNKLRQTKRTALSTQQIIRAQNDDNGANM